MEGEISTGSCEGQGPGLSGPESLQELMHPGPLLTLWHRVWCLDHSWRKGDEMRALMRGQRRGPALGMACIPVFC